MESRNVWYTCAGDRDGAHVFTFVHSSAMSGFYYRPQRIWGKVMFSQVSVSLFTDMRGVSVPACTTGYMTRGLYLGGSLSGGSLSRGSLSKEGGGLCLGGPLSGVSLLGRPPVQ